MSFFTNVRDRDSRDGHDRYILSINSGDRDKDQFPNPNSYGITMPIECRNIRKVELRTVEFTETQYAITALNNVLAFDRNGTVTLITIKEGTYTGESLATELTLQMGAAAPGGGGVSVTYDADTGKLSFNSTVALDIMRVASSIIPGNANYSETLIWTVLGLGQQTTDVTLPAPPAVFIPDQQINLMPDRCLFMEVSFPRILQGHMRTTNQHHQAFAKILFSTNSVIRFDGFIQTDPYDFVSAPVVFQNIMRLEHIRFEFKRPNGDLYDFHFQDHSFTLRITTE